jgi:hypothetical protein
MRKFQWVSLLGLLVLASCKNETLPPVSLEPSVYSLQPGNEFVYQVDSIHYNDFSNRIDTFRFQMRERVDSVIEQSSSTKKIRIFQESLDPSTQSWNPISTVLVTYAPGVVRTTEDNNQFIRLILPIYEGNSWKGNVLTNNDPWNNDWEYYYYDVWRSKEINGRNFDSTVSVNWVESTTFIDEMLGEETYAQGIGRIYRRFKNIRFKTNGNIESGTDVTWKIISWKK